MRLLSLHVENFRAIQSARLEFGRGLNVVHGPNDRGKSTLTDAIRAALLVAPGSAEARSFATWGAAAGQFPSVVLGFESQNAVWRVEKVFGQGSRVKAHLEKSTDGGARYHVHAQGRDVEGKLRELLNWGLAPPGGRGASQRVETYLTTALLGKQGDVGAIFSASLQGDQDDTGRALVTRALDAMGRDPVVTRVLDALRERTGEAYTKSGRHKRSADSPLVRAQTALLEREKRLRDLQEAARRGKEIEDDIRRLLQERETALEKRDQSRAGIEMLREHSGAAARRTQLRRDAEALKALESAQQQHLIAQAALTAIGDEYTPAVEAAASAREEAQAARDRLARARAAHESSEEVATSALAARVAELHAELEKAGTRLAALRDWESLQSRHSEAQLALRAAGEEAVRTSAELNLALALDEVRKAAVLTEALSAATTDHEREMAREAATAAAATEADAAWRATIVRLDTARNAEEQARRAAEAHAMSLRVLDTRILHSEAALRDEKESLERARTSVFRARRAQEAQIAAVAAETRAGEIEASLADNAADISRCEARLRVLESAALELRRRATASTVEEWTTQESTAREHRRQATESRDRAARLETEAASVRFPSSQHMASLRAQHAEIKGRKEAGPAAASPEVALVLLAGAGGAATGYFVAQYSGAVGTLASISVAMLVGIATAAIAAFASIGTRKRNAERSWRAEIERLESRVAAETEAVLAEAGVATLEEIESKRQFVDRHHTEAGRLRQEAADLDRGADSMFDRIAGLSSLRRDLESLNGQMAPREASAIPAEDLAGSVAVVHENTLREQERLDEARRVRDHLQTGRMSQAALCASKRAIADSALAERGEAPDPETEVADAESRWTVAEEELAALREERKQEAALPQSPVAVASENELREAEQEAATRERRAEDLRREHQEVVRALAGATARLELARREAEAIDLSEVEQRAATARKATGACVEPLSVDSAHMRHEQAKARVTTASANVEMLAAGIPEGRRKAEAMGSVAAAEEEELRLQEALREAETAVPQIASSAQELQDSEEAASSTDQRLRGLRERAEVLTSKQAELKARVERARGEFEACGRQAVGLDLEATQRTLADVATVPEVSAEEIERAKRALDSDEAILSDCEGRLNEVRGKLGLVAGRVGIERLDDEQEAVQGAREFAEEQELDYEASRHLLELLDAAEAKRTSHLGRCLAAPVTERFLALTGDLYAHVQLDPDLRMEGFVAAGAERRVEELSVGTREQLATIVRLAIAAQLKTAVLLDDQLVHSDSGRLEWFRKQLHHSVREHDHQVIVMTCRLEDYVSGEIANPKAGVSSEGSHLGIAIISVLDVLRRLER